MSDNYSGDTEWCDHEFTDWIQVGLGPKNKKRFHSRKCEKCGYLDGEWRELDSDSSQ